MPCARFDPEVADSTWRGRPGKPVTPPGRPLVVNHTSQVESAAKPVAVPESGPILAGDLRLDERLPEMAAGGRYRAARLLTRVHDRPVGEVLLPLAAAPLNEDGFAARLRPLLAERVIAPYETAPPLPRGST